MGDENQPSKKRAAGRELSRDNPGLDDEEDVSEQEMGTFQKASDEVLAARRIVKVRRQQTSTEPSAPSSNPFAGIRLVPPTAPAATESKIAEEKTDGEDAGKKDETKAESETEKKEAEEKPGEISSKEQTDPVEQAAEINQADEADERYVGNSSEEAVEPKTADEEKDDDCAKKTVEAERAVGKQAEGEKTEGDDQKENEKPDAGGSAGAPLSSFGQLSNNQNAFTGLSGTGFSSSSFSFGSIQKDGSSLQSSLPTFSFGASNNGNTSLFGATGASIGTKSEGSALRPLQEVPTETGEENEETVFSADSALFEFVDGGWKERGKGEVKLNVLKSEAQKARLVMRAKGNLRLILNASLYPDMKVTKMDKKGVSFPCVNTATEGKHGLSTFALKFKESLIVEEFSTAVSAHKGKPSTALKTPENSPKASED